MVPPTEQPRPKNAVILALEAHLSSNPVGRVVERTLVGLAQIELVDRAMTLAAQMFTSVLPVLLAASIVADTTVVRRTVRDRFLIDTSLLLPGDAPPMIPQTAAFGIIGVIMVVISGTSFARALGRMYGKVWHTPSLGLSHAWRWFAVLFVVAGSIPLVALIQLSQIPILILVGQWCVWTCVWAGCPYLLTMRFVSGRVLWITGAITATLLTGLDIASRIAMPRVIADSYAHFGVLGIVFTGIGWLFVFAVVLVAAPVMAEASMTDRVPAYSVPTATSDSRSSDRPPEANDSAGTESDGSDGRS
ncbi:hypothetical protein [Rhodococcus sp. O3]|uniref:hypothetical protein n=1 Tax=Rhodococcus sp. O3 TaxID=3404919 RepID=UPI003B6792BB